MSNELLIQRRERLLGRKAPLFYEQALHIVKGDSVYLYDSEGRQYLDVYNNVPNVGHCHPRVVAALADQASQLNIHTRYLHETILDYGERLTNTFDESLSMLFLTCSGSESNDIALRIARHHTQAQGIVCTNSTYHGNTTAVDELATLFRDGKAPSKNVMPVPFPCAYRPISDATDEALADAYVDTVKDAIDTLKASGAGFAGMLICPLFANEGLPDTPPSYMRKVAELVRREGGLLIFDEVQSGFGRSGEMWGQQAVGVVPDIVTLGKPMGNGHPLAGVVTRADLANAFREDVMYFNTFGGNPVSCRVGQAVLDVMEDEHLLDNAKSVGGLIKKALVELQGRFESIGDVRGSGLFFAVELVEDRISKTPATQLAADIVNQMKERGVLISKIGPFDNILKMRPPLVFSKDNAERLLTTLETVLEACNA